MAFAHARLVVHRDIKPGNVLVTPDGQVRLLDFGIAKLVDGDAAEETELTRAAGRALTPCYASPEQVRGGPIGTASDVYSLGVVAFELLADVRPHLVGRNGGATKREVSAPHEAPRASATALDPALKRQMRGDVDAILAKALEDSTDERYATPERASSHRLCRGRGSRHRPGTLHPPQERSPDRGPFTGPTCPVSPLTRVLASEGAAFLATSGEIDMHAPATARRVPPALDAEFVATRDIALPAAPWGVAMATVVCGALAHAATAPQSSTAPQEPAAVVVLAA